MVIWEVSDLTRYVKQVIEDDARLRDVWVEGEVSNFTIAMSGHAYFTLKDASSQLKCVMFRPHVLRMKRRPEAGERGVARGPIRVYEAQGVYQLYVEFLAPAGLGEAQIRLEELLTRLEAEGLFEPSRKRPLPTWPRRVGVVTSATGAVIHDIRTVIARRFPLVEIILAPTPVQGEDATPRICQAIDDLNRLGDVDVIILARGGGSREDLAVFNEEAVARSIFASRAPVVSAIGHETDTTISDLVADQRAPTPSAAAELVVPDSREIRARLADLARMLRWHARLTLDRATSEVEEQAARIARRSPIEELARQQQGVADLAGRALTAIEHQWELSRERVRAREAQLASLDPNGVLRRGYSVSWRSADGEVVRSVTQLEAGAKVHTRVSDGVFESRVISTGGD
ncbi:MAG: exodeoxyribonuclease VII large subunit [Chloroflexota bacterium]